MPFEVRFIKSDSGSFLSPATERMTAFLSINLHRKFKGYNSFLEEFEKNISHLNPRPHWGKLFYKNPLEQYKNIDTFNNIRKSLDPNGKFLNEFFLRVFLKTRVGE